MLGTDGRELGRRGRGLAMGDTVQESGGGEAEEVRGLFWPRLLPVQPTITPEKLSKAVNICQKLDQGLTRKSALRSCSGENVARPRPADENQFHIVQIYNCVRSQTQER